MSNATWKIPSTLPIPTTLTLETLSAHSVNRKGFPWSPEDGAALTHPSVSPNYQQTSLRTNSFHSACKSPSPLPYLPPQEQIPNQHSSNGAQFIYSLLYLLLIYNITLISQEYDWGTLEHRRKRLRCTIVKGESFKQDYLLQLPKKILFPVMTYSTVTHWMLGEALQTQEAVWMDNTPALGRHVEHSKYMVRSPQLPRNRFMC
jgi:hypothetical protein